MTGFDEIPFTFTCGPERLVGILHLPHQASVKLGLLILVGGPQYRVGPHRQYLHLARHLSANGIPVMRFDWRGVGDSEGEYRGFEHCGPDLAAAVSAFEAKVPELDGIILWGLCEGASTILLSGLGDPRVLGAVLLNPWVRNETTLARTHLKHYYLKRFLSRDLWRRILGGKASFGAMAKSFIATLCGAFKPKARVQGEVNAPFPTRMAKGLQSFTGPVLLIQSGNDLVAREFDGLAASDPAWDCLKGPKIERFDLGDSDHSFSTEPWRQAVANKVESWIKAL